MNVNGAQTAASGIPHTIPNIPTMPPNLYAPMAPPHAAATAAADILRNLAPRATLDVGGGARAVRAPPATSAPEPLREQDRLLPLANVARMMTIEIPKDAKISRDSKVFMQECVTEFICFITSEAHDFSIAAGRKATTQEDVLNAMDALGARMGTTQPHCTHA